jgi:hypothetical protein
MLDKFWESIGEGAAEKWIEYVFSPAFFFWAGGALLYVWKRVGWQEAWDSVNGWQVFQQVAAVIAGAIVLILSTLLMRQLRYGVLRILEGYWPGPFRTLASKLARWRGKRITQLEKDWNIRVAQKPDTPEAQAELARLETLLHYVPADPADYKPTVLGNILRAGETAPYHKYGLDVVVCWPRLWLLLPDNARADLATARQSLDTLSELWFWGLLFVLWTFLTPWALLIAFLWMYLAYFLLQQSARAYADLLEAAFDLYRFALYEALHWPLPASLDEEPEAGKRLTEFLWRGTSEGMAYRPPQKAR